MRWLLSVLRAIFGCHHRDTYREYRPIGKTRVLHLVCLDCDRAVPAIGRTPKELRQMTKAWKEPRPVKAKRTTPAEVRPFRRSER